MQVEFIDGKAIMSQEDFLKHFGKPQEQASLASPEKPLTFEVTDIPSGFGIPRDILGFNYLRAAIVMAHNDQTYIGAVTKRLYPDIAKTFSTIPNRAERAMRHAIEAACNSNPAAVGAYFSREKPTVSEFIATVADNIRLRRHHEAD